MSQYNASDSDGDKTIRSELSCGGYFTAYDKVALPNYLLHLPSHNDVIMDIDIKEELNGRGNGGDLDYDGENTIDFDDKMREFKLDISRVLLGDDKIEKANERGMNSVLLHVGETMDPDGVKVPKSPYY